MLQILYSSGGLFATKMDIKRPGVSYDYYGDGDDGDESDESCESGSKVKLHPWVSDGG